MCSTAIEKTSDVSDPGPQGRTALSIPFSPLARDDIGSIKPAVTRPSGASTRKFEMLVQRYGSDLFRFAVWLCRDPALAADLVQETYLRAWRAFDRLKDERAVKSWMITILRREFARSFARKVPPIDRIDDLMLADPNEPGPDARTELDQLRCAIAGLEAMYRDPLALQVILGLTIREIASLLELTEVAVMTRVFRAREKLKLQLSTLPHEPGVERA